MAAAAAEADSPILMRNVLSCAKLRMQRGSLQLQMGESQ